MKILGIDPALNKCGYAIVEYDSNSDNFILISSGVIINISSLDSISKLKNIVFGVQKILENNNDIERIAIEDSFVNVNMRSSLSIAVARGALIGLGIIKGIEIDEITPKEMKKLITGNGNADKFSVQKMVSIMLSKFDFKTNDESDAIGVAISSFLKKK